MLVLDQQFDLTGKNNQRMVIQSLRFVQKGNDMHSN